MNRLNLLWGEDLYAEELAEWVARTDKEIRALNYKSGIGARVEKVLDERYAMVVRVVPNGYQLHCWADINTGQICDGRSLLAPGNPTDRSFLVEMKISA